jgi:hypothetical protein
MNLTLDELSKLAGLLYPHKRIGIGPDEIVMCDKPDGVTGYEVFNPSLTGSPEQKAQALDVIVAALTKLHSKTEIFFDRDAGKQWSMYSSEAGKYVESGKCEHLLEAAARALLGAQL